MKMFEHTNPNLEIDLTTIGYVKSSGDCQVKHRDLNRRLRAKVDWSMRLLVQASLCPWHGQFSSF